MNGTTRRTYTVRHQQHPGDVTGTVSIASCNDCGSLVGDPVVHGQNCSRIQPPPPPPVWESARTIQDRAWLASLFLLHTFYLRSNTSGKCKCGLGPITERDWTDHMAEVVYRALEGRSDD